MNNSINQLEVQPHSTKSGTIGYSDLQMSTSDTPIKKLIIDLSLQEDCVAINGNIRMKKSGFRKVANYYRISTEIVSEYRTEHNKSFVRHYIVKAYNLDGRAMSACGSCSSQERSFAHPEHDVRSTAQTRATNRAISDLVGLGDVSAEELGYPIEIYEAHESEKISEQQSNYLTVLVHKYFVRKPERKAEMLAKIPLLSKKEATVAIKKIKTFLLENAH